MKGIPTPTVISSTPCALNRLRFVDETVSTAAACALRLNLAARSFTAFFKTEFLVASCSALSFHSVKVGSKNRIEQDATRNFHFQNLLIMAEFLPFRGLRPDPTRVDLAAVLCPPYDVIKGDARAELLARDSHNIVAVELAAPYGETPAPEAYAQSAALLQQWQSEGILIRDDASFYIYEQEFEHPTRAGLRLKRRGILGALTLEAFGEGVKAHEHTLAGPKADRLNLLRATRTNTSPIFGLYNDNDGWVAGVIANFTTENPLCEATDADHVTHRLWKVTDDESVNAIEAAFEDESIIIADGHHRYETALNFAREQSENNPDWTGAEGANAVMMLCVSVDDAGLIVLPTHRVVNGVDETQIAGLLAKLAPYFNVTIYSSDPESLAEVVNRAPRPSLGLVLGNKRYVLALRTGEAHLGSLDESKSAATNALHVTLLHRLILEKELGIDEAGLASGAFVTYTIHAGEAAAKVESGQAQAAFILPATPVKSVADVAGAGDKMPQKSTYFFPKVVTGMVLRPLDA